MEGDLFYNTGLGFNYMRFRGAYFKFTPGKGWDRVEESQLPKDVRWSPMHPKQQTFYEPLLKDIKLID